MEHPKNKYEFEEVSRQKAFEREKEWDDRKKTESQTQKTIDDLKKQIDTLKEAVYGVSEENKKDQ